jgi:hypothetical protein
VSLVDPTEPELLEMLAADGWPVSGEPLPDLSTPEKQELEAALLKIGAKIFRSPERLDGWEEAYSAFAEAFQANGAKLSSCQVRLDLLNMLFNFALRTGWITHLIVVADTPELSDITSPKRVDGKAYCAKPDHRGFVVVGKKQSVDWFHARIQPAVTEWSVKAAEWQMKYDALREQTLEMALTEPPESNTDTAVLVASRKAMLENYKKRFRDTETGKQYSDKRLFTAKQHSMHKPEFYKWKNGLFPSSKPASISFERFLTGKAHPIRRETKKEKTKKQDKKP